MKATVQGDDDDDDDTLFYTHKRQGREGTGTNDSNVWLSKWIYIAN